MAGYSGTPLVRKLGIREGHRVVLLNAPAAMNSLLADLPPGVEIRDSLRGRTPLDVIVLFAPSRAALTARFEKAAGRMVENGALWIAWPKKASGMKSDLSEDVVRDIGLAAGLVDNKVCAVDETWSALRLVIPVSRRGPRPRR